MTLGDVDGDGNLDAVHANHDHRNQRCLGDGSGGFSCADVSSDSNYTIGVALGDIDGDGNLDAVFANNGQPNRRCLGDGSGGSTCADVSSEGNDSWGVALGDVDGDGDLDAIFANVSQNNRRCLGDGSGGFTCTDVSSDGNASWGVALGDVDGDGNLDAVFGNYNEHNSRCLGDGSGGFTCADVSSDGNNSWGVALGDMDGDGNLDAIFANYNERNRRCLGDGSGGFTCTDVSSSTNSSYGVALGNVNGGGNGGGVLNFGGTLTINNSALSTNSAGDDGGGLANDGGTVTLNNSLLSDNRAGDDGGGLHNGGTVNLNNTTLSGNHAERDGGGLANSGTVSLNNVTFASNGAVRDGGAIQNNSGTVNMQNGIIANNFWGGYCYGYSGTSANNLVDIATCGIAASAVTNFDHAMGDNGGPTLTHALQSGSNALDSGTGNCPGHTAAALTTDQRGADRPYNTTCDIGAYEYRETITNGTCGGAGLTGTQTFDFVASGNTVTIDINSGNGLTCITAQEMGAAHLLAPGPAFESNWWHITGDVSSGFNVDLTMPDSSTTPKVCKWPGGQGGYGWDCQGTHVDNGGSVTRQGVTSFSDWAVGDNVGPTSVTLHSVMAHKSAKAPVALSLGLLGIVVIGLALIRQVRRS